MSKDTLAKIIIIHVSLALLVGLFIGLAAAEVGTIPVHSDTPYTTAIVVGMIFITAMPAALGWMSGFLVGKEQ